MTWSYLKPSPLPCLTYSTRLSISTITSIPIYTTSAEYWPFNVLISLSEIVSLLNEEGLNSNLLFRLLTFQNIYVSGPKVTIPIKTRTIVLKEQKS